MNVFENPWALLELNFVNLEFLTFPPFGSMSPLTHEVSMEAVTFSCGILDFIRKSYKLKQKKPRNGGSHFLQ